MSTVPTERHNASRNQEVAGAAQLAAVVMLVPTEKWGEAQTASADNLSMSLTRKPE
jgi:hypothetical protein